MIICVAVSIWERMTEMNIPHFQPCHLNHILLCYTISSFLCVIFVYYYNCSFGYLFSMLSGFLYRDKKTILNKIQA